MRLDKMAHQPRQLSIYFMQVTKTEIIIFDQRSINYLTPRGKLRLGGVLMRRSALDLFLTTLEWMAQETQ